MTSPRFTTRRDPVRHTASHCWVTLFADGGNCGQLKMRREDADALEALLATSRTEADADADIINDDDMTIGESQ